MKLYPDLDAKLLKIIEDPERGRVHRVVATLAEADGVQFACPKCFEANSGLSGTHLVICWFTGVDGKYSPAPGRWNVVAPSTGLDDLTFGPPGQYSVQVVGGCNWHGYVERGEANTR